MNKTGFDLRPCQRADCARLFTPHWRRNGGQKYLTAYCCWTCATTSVAEQNKGKAPVKAIKERARQMGLRRAAQLRERYGHLSARETELLAQAEAHGYRRGYNCAYRLVRKTKASAA